VKQTATLRQPGAFEIHIHPNRSWLRIDWRELWEYRDLALLLVRRDFVAKYKQTVLGPAWFILQPLVTTLVLVVVFGKVAQLDTDGMPPLLFYLCNMLAWNYLAQNVTTASATFAANAHLFGKVYFPRLVVPLSVIISNFLAFALSLVTFAAFFLYFKIFTPAAGTLHFGWQAAFLPLLLLQTAALSLGVSLWFSAMTAKYRDITHLTPVLVQLWMFATVIVPASRVPAEWRWVIWANAASAIVEGFRLCLLGRGTLAPAQLGVSVAITVALLLTGLLLFQRVERTAADTA
jgi:lipopolysaccharide transport system permease protein